MNVNMFLIVVYALHNLLRTLKDAFLWKFNVSYNYVLIYDYTGLKKRYVIRQTPSQEIYTGKSSFWFVLTPLCQNYLRCYHTSTHNLFTTSSECIIRTTAIHWVNLTSIDCCFVYWNSIRIPEKICYY